MQLIPLKTKRVHPGDDLISALLEAKKSDLKLALCPGDILVISSKAVAMSEGRIVDLKTLTIASEAAKLSKRCGRSPGFCQAVLDEVQFRNGEVRGTCPGSPRGARSAKWGAILTELKPHGLTVGTIFAPNAGLDESNIEKGFAVGWPKDPVESVRRLRKQLEAQIQNSKFEIRNPKQIPNPKTQNLSKSPHVAVILSDSCCMPRRRGVTAYALAVSGIDPLRDEAGTLDLFGKPLRITMEAIADQLATAANTLMGNAAQSIPAVIIRDHGLPLSNFEGWVPGINPSDDLFQGL